MKIAMLGTRGVPAQYGGFETAVEEVGSRLVDAGHSVTVYCRNSGQEETSYRGMRLVNLPAIRRRTIETLSHTALSVMHAAATKPDAAILFNAANAPFIKALKMARIPTAVHMDGLEWKRAKWEGAGARYYQKAEIWAVRSGMPLIADAVGIKDYLFDTYGVDSEFIPYGAEILSPGSSRLHELDLKERDYHLVVARLEPENHVDVIIEGYLRSGSHRPLVVVGSVPYESDHVRALLARAADSGVRMIGGIWDQELLNQLYAHARSYLHGHSVGGTNPSLLRALGCAAPVTAFDVVFNREVTGGNARFFDDAEGVAAAISGDDADDADDADGDVTVVRGVAGQRHAQETYQWDRVAGEYERLLLRMKDSALEGRGRGRASLATADQEQ